MKRVSFKVAKALKEAGYPQEKGEYYYSYTGHLFHEKEADDEETESLFFDASYAPYVMEAWLWLWREKKECINIMTDIHGDCRSVCNNGDVMPKYSDPEESIIAAIEYLVTNNLIK